MTQPVKLLEQKAGQVMAQIPRINILEEKLEIQSEDAELGLIQKSLEKTLKNTRNKVETGN